MQQKVSLVMSQSCVAWPGSRREGYKNRDFPAASPAPSLQSGFTCEPGEFSASNSISINWDAAVGAELGNDSLSELWNDREFGLGALFQAKLFHSINSASWEGRFVVAGWEMQISNREVVLFPTTKGKSQLSTDYLTARLQLNYSELGFYSGWRKKRDLVFMGQ